MATLLIIKADRRLSQIYDIYSNDLGIETVWNCLESGLKRGSSVKYSAKKAVWQNLVMAFK